MAVTDITGKTEVVEVPRAAKKAAQPKSQSYRDLVWWKFKRNRLAVVGGVFLITVYFICVAVPGLFTPYEVDHQSKYILAPPQLPHLWDKQGNFRGLFVYGYKEVVDQKARKRSFTTDETVIYPVNFFVRGDTHQLFGVIPADIRLFGTNAENGHVYVLGTDSLGRDMLSRIIYGGRLSLLLGLIGQFITLVLGSILGVASGYFGGGVDNLIQRIVEFLAAFPQIPLLMALSAAIPIGWSPIAIYFMITLLLAFLSWGGLCRQVRGLVLSLREREYVLAARSFGTGNWPIMTRHLLPNTMSHIIVIATLAIPGMILAETALSFLGLGLKPPLTSWGVLLQEVQTSRALRFSPWLLTPVPVVIMVVMAFNFLGDGLRDAMDPYSK
jgi:peptide/nickel transport system permease protein